MPCYCDVVHVPTKQETASSRMVEDVLAKIETQHIGLVFIRTEPGNKNVPTSQRRINSCKDFQVFFLLFVPFVPQYDQVRHRQLVEIQA